MIPRLLLPRLKENIQQNRLVLLSGPRRTGKRSLVELALTELGHQAIHFDVSERKVKKHFTEVSREHLEEIFGNHTYVVFHEAQYLDRLQEIIEFILAGEINVTLILCCSYRPMMDEVLLEAIRLQGLELQLFAPSFYELAQHYSLPEEEKNLEQRLIYGNYPEVVSDLTHAEDTLSTLLDEAIFTQLGAGDRINKQEQLLRMLQIISFGIGEPISYNEVGERSGLDNETVERYVDLLELCGILIRFPCWNNGHRYELKKSHVIYFSDNGIRNALIRNFNPTYLRNDLDQLWRNWVIAERVKWNRLNGNQPEYRFWRTHTRQTMDFIEFSEAGIRSYKTSWEKKKKMKYPEQFTRCYPQVSTHTVNRSTYWGFLTKK